MFLRKNGISEKNWSSFPLAHPEKPSPQHFNNCSAPLFNFIQKNFKPIPHLKEGDRDYAFYMTDYKGQNIKLLPFYMIDTYL